MRPQAPQYAIRIVIGPSVSEKAPIRMTRCRAVSSSSSPQPAQAGPGAASTSRTAGSTEASDGESAAASMASATASRICESDGPIDLARDAVGSIQDAEQDVLRVDGAVAEGASLPQRPLEHVLRPLRERDVSGRRALAPPDDLRDPFAGRIDRDPLRAESNHGDPVRLHEETEQQVLGSDVVVVEVPRLLLREDDDPSRPVGEELEHRPQPSAGPVFALPCGEIDELEVPAERGVQVTHVGPDRVRPSVRSVGEPDVVAVEHRTGLAARRVRTRVEEHGVARV